MAGRGKVAADPLPAMLHLGERLMIPKELKEALKLLAPEDAEAALKQFLESDANDQAGMMSFILGDGPEYCRQLRLEHEEDIPTASDLKNNYGI